MLAPRSARVDDGSVCRETLSQHGHARSLFRESGSVLRQVFPACREGLRALGQDVSAFEAVLSPVAGCRLGAPRCRLGAPRCPVDTTSERGRAPRRPLEKPGSHLGASRRHLREPRRRLGPPTCRLRVRRRPPRAPRRRVGAPAGPPEAPSPRLPAPRGHVRRPSGHLPVPSGHLVNPRRPLRAWRRPASASSRPLPTPRRPVATIREPVPPPCRLLGVSRGHVPSPTGHRDTPRGPRPLPSRPVGRPRRAPLARGGQGDLPDAHPGALDDQGRVAAVGSSYKGAEHGRNGRSRYPRSINSHPRRSARRWARCRSSAQRPCAACPEREAFRGDFLIPRSGNHLGTRTTNPCAMSVKTNQSPATATPPGPPTPDTTTRGVEPRAPW
jgi:hypothetical protein